MKPSARPLVVPPGDGENLPRPDTGGRLTVKIEGAATGGALTVYESARTVDDARGPGVHRHGWFDEAFYVLEGEYLFEFEEGGVVAVPPGGLVYVPRGALHGFRSSGRAYSRLLTICTPSGLEDAMREVVSAPRSEIEGVWHRHGIVFGRS